MMVPTTLPSRPSFIFHLASHHLPPYNVRQASILNTCHHSYYLAPKRTLPIGPPLHTLPSCLSHWLSLLEGGQGVGETVSRHREDGQLLWPRREIAPVTLLFFRVTLLQVVVVVVMGSVYVVVVVRTNSASKPRNPGICPVKIPERSPRACQTSPRVTPPHLTSATAPLGVKEKQRERRKEEEKDERNKY
ncbi:hypothetical protein E2C01_029708 [Portunus trituberculatus]|uniref:Uncharacterized protein n=1 Tax=Portunus trituberculatus TaxID=210409 RepID=A0A5B7ESY5_PORTR|nr:hypothetical protein [Portunus trituberculatus]